MNVIFIFISVLGVAAFVFIPLVLNLRERARDKKDEAILKQTLNQEKNAEHTQASLIFPNNENSESHNSNTRLSKRISIKRVAIKCSIWFLCIFVYSGIITLLKMFVGIILGTIPTVILVIITFFVASKLCKIYNRKIPDKNKYFAIVSKAKEQGISFDTYIQQNIPKDCIEICKQNKKNPYKAELYISSLYKNNEIERDIYQFLLDKYC